MELAQTSLVVFASLLMVASLGLLIVPAAPVTLLLAVIATLAGFLTGFDTIPVSGLVVIWVVALVGASAEAWLPYFGLRGSGVGCLGIVAFFVGVVVGTFLIPIPILGSVIGGVVCVIGVQVLQLGELRAALRAGGQALKFVLLALLAETVFSLLVLLVWFVMIASS